MLEDEEVGRGNYVKVEWEITKLIHTYLIHVYKKFNSKYTTFYLVSPKDGNLAVEPIRKKRNKMSVKEINKVLDPYGHVVEVGEYELTAMSDRSMFIELMRWEVNE
ncbi:MAG: hypothetical protein ACTSUO_06095 [Candidatus Thorarchaeota archaeon]